MTWTGLNFSLGMDCQDTFLSRIGRTLWEFLNNVTSAVQRYLTPAPPNTGNDDTNTSPEARVCKEKDSDKEEEENDLIEDTERESKCWSHVEKDLTTANETVVHWMRREIVFSNETESMSEQCMRVQITSTEEEKIAGVGDRFRAEQVNQHPEKAVLEEADNGQEKGNITQDIIKLGVEAGNSCILANEQERKKQSDKTTANESHKFFDQGIEKKLQLVEETDARLAGDEYSFREEDESEWEIKKQRESATKYEDLIKSNEVNVFGGHTEEQDETEKVKAEHGVEEMVMTCEDKMRDSDGKTEPVAGETPFREHEVLLCKTKDTIGTEPGETADGVDVGGAGQGSNEENERSTEETMGIKCITKTSIGVLERRLKEEEMRGEWQGVQKNQKLEKKEKSYKKDMSGVDERDISYLYELGREERIIYVEKGNMQVLTEDKLAEEDRKEGESKVEINTEVQPEQNKKADKTSKENTYEKKQEVKIEGEFTSVIFGDFETAIKEVDVSIEEGESDKVREEEENRRAEQNETVEMEAQGREKEIVEEEGEVDKWRDELHKEDKSHGSATEDTDESDVVEEGGEDGERERCLFELEKEGNNIYEGMTDMEILNEERGREENKINEEVAASWVDVRETMEANKVAEENKDISGTEWGDDTNHDRKLYEENERETGERSSKEEPAGAEVSMEDGASDKVREEEENRGAEQNETVEIEVQEREKERVEEEGDVDKWRDELYKEDKSQESAIEERDESDIVVEGGQDREKERCLFELEEEENNVYEGMRDTEILHEERGREENEIKEEVAAYWVDVRETVEANEVAEENKDISGTEWGDDIIHDRKVYEENEKKTEERSSKEDSPEGMISMEDGKSDKVREEEENRGAEQNEMVEIEVQEREKERVEEEGDVDKWRDELYKEDKSQGSAIEERDESDIVVEGGQDREKERCLFELEEEENNVYEGMTDMEILHEERWREENKINEDVAAYWVDVGETVETNEVAEEKKDISGTEWGDDIIHDIKAYENDKEREEISSKEEPAEGVVSMEDGESNKVREEEENRGAEQNETVAMEAQEWLQVREPEVKHETIVAGEEEEEMQRKTQRTRENEVQRPEEYAEMEGTQGNEVKLPERVITLNMRQPERHKEVEEEGDKWRNELDEEDKNQGSVTENREKSDAIEGGEDGEKEICLFELEKEENNLHEGMRDTEIHPEERWREEKKINEEVAASWVDAGESETREVNVQKISEEENIDISLTEWRDDRKHGESVYGVKEKEILKIYLTEEQHYENINILNEASDITKETEKKADFEQKEEPCMHEDNVFRGNSHIIDLFKGEQGQETKEEKHDNECLEKLATALIVGKTRNGGNVSDENVDTKTMKEGDGRDLNVAPVTKSELNEGFDANVETKAIALRDGWAIEKTKEASQSGDTRDAMDRGVIRGAESERDFNECTVDTTEGQRTKIQLKTEKGVQLDEDENFTNAREIQSQCSEAEMPETGEHRTETTGQSRTIIVNQERDGNEGRKHITEDEVGKKRTQKRTHESDEEFDLQLDSTSLDFTAQKSRIALKNRQVRAPKNPRILLQKPSLSPTSAPPALVEEEATKPVGIKVGGVGMMGFRLPGIGAGFPVLKKTEIRVEERGQEDTGQMKAPTPNLGPDDREPAATKKWAAGAVGVMLPGFGPGMPALRKTDKEIKLKEKTAEDTTVSHGKFGASSGGGAERNGEESKEKGVKIVGASTIKLPSFGAGFPVLRKTEIGSKLKGEEGKKSEAEWIETENNQPEKAGSDSPMLVSELKKKFMKTERK